MCLSDRYFAAERYRLRSVNILARVLFSQPVPDVTVFL